MTDEEIEKKLAEFAENELYKRSTGLCKHWQLTELHAGDGNTAPLMQGKVSQVMNINGSPAVVIFNFKDGYICSDGDEPAIEAPLHWEYWSDGYITKIEDGKTGTVEYWENGIPIRIEKKSESESE